MGRLINTGDLHNQVLLNKSDWGLFATTIDNLIEGIVSQVSTAEAVPKDQYEARLKTDMVAMLTEIQLEIEEKVHSYHSRYCLACEAIDRKSVSNLIQEKIDALKAESEE